MGMQRHPSGWLVAWTRLRPAQAADFGKPLYRVDRRRAPRGVRARAATEPARRRHREGRGYRADLVFEQHWRRCSRRWRRADSRRGRAGPIPINRAERRRLAKAAR
jgi:hypothetical protein